MGKYIVEARNVRGLGAVAVCKRLLPKILEVLSQSNSVVQVNLSDVLYQQVVDSISPASKVKFSVFKGGIATKILTILKYFAEYRGNPDDILIVLGDIPFFTKVNQRIFVQQAHLLAPNVVKQVGTSLKYKIMRFIFRRNIKYVSKIFVQTKFMKSALMASYDITGSKLRVLPHEVNLGPDNSSFDETTEICVRDQIVFFYPASAYPHKNHKLIWKTIPLLERRGITIRFDVTLSTANIPSEVRKSSLIRPLGTLTYQQCIDYYSKSDVLFFPSLLESYGLPLIEGQRFRHLRILASDTEFSRELCGHGATYFNPYSEEDLVAKIIEVISDIKSRTEHQKLENIVNFVTWDDMAKALVFER